AEARRELAEARAEWDRLAPVPGERANALTHRFARAVEACHARHRTWRAGAGLKAQLDGLAAEAEGLARATAVPKPRAWQALEERWTALLPDDAASREELADPRTRFDAAHAAVEQRWRDEAAARTAEQHENVARLTALANRLEELAT